MDTIDPTTGKKIKSYPEFSWPKINSILNQAQDSWQLWRTTSWEKRGSILKKAGSILRASQGHYAAMMAQEMGKPFAQGQGEIEKCALGCDFYADRAEDFLSQRMIKTDAAKSFVAYEPLGLILAVMPWNFPFWQVFRCAAPNLMAGNGIILKHASNVCGCALAIEDIFKQAGLPPFLFSTVLVPGQKTKYLIEHPFIKAVSLTGSTAAGMIVAATAGAVLKKTVLELGGSDPYIILEDADLDCAIDACVKSRMINGGQSCIAAKRFIIVEKIFKEFEERFVAYMTLTRMGPPLEPGVDLGPMSRHDLRDFLHGQVKMSLRQGAKLLLGGAFPLRPGAFYPPTVLTGVKSGMRVCREETFGPVAALMKVKDKEQAIRAANDTVFGLGAAIFTRDIKRAESMVSSLQAGVCFINDFVRSDPRLPFGGLKQSGYGRELSQEGIREFVNIKTVWIK